MEGKTVGCGRPRGLPLILRFSRLAGGQPVRSRLISPRGEKPSSSSTRMPYPIVVIIEKYMSKANWSMRYLSQVENSYALYLLKEMVLFGM